MPEGLPKTVKADEAVRAFEKAGGVTRSGKGSHVNLKIPNGQIVTMPRHGEILVGLLHASIRKAGLTTEEFLTLMGR